VKRREFIMLLGGAVAWPLGARAQQRAVTVIGFLNSQSATPFSHMVAGFRRGLRDAGFLEGQNIAIEYRLYEFREYVLAGGLVSYGVNIVDLYREAAQYTAKILKGAKPSDLPIVQPTKFDFVINQKTAKALRLDVPDKMLALVDEVIE
jgi:ABC transporter substrate binding protein